MYMIMWKSLTKMQIKLLLFPCLIKYNIWRLEVHYEVNKYITNTNQTLDYHSLLILRTSEPKYNLRSQSNEQDIAMNMALCVLQNYGVLGSMMFTFLSSASWSRFYPTFIAIFTHNIYWQPVYLFPVDSTNY